MKEKKNSIDQRAFFHEEHKNWLQQLNFYQDEIKFFQNELLLVLHKHMDRLSIIEHVDEYRVIFMKKLAQIDEIRHQIIIHEKKIGNTLDPVPYDLWAHDQLREEMDSFIANFTSMKENFKRFASHND